MLASKRDMYKAMVRDMDRLLGQMLEAIDLERTLVILVADNGTPTETRAPAQRVGKVKASTYEDGVRVPMVIRGPGVPRGVESESLVSFVDLLPTIVELLDLPLPEDQVDGVSIVPLLRDPEHTVREHAWVGYQYSQKADFGVVTPRWKYREAAKDGAPVSRFLFDLEADELETNNLVGDPALADVVTELQGLLNLHRPE